MPIGKVWIYSLLFVCLFVCLFVLLGLRISPARITLVASYFAWWFKGVLGRESPILSSSSSYNFKNDTVHNTI